MFSEWVLVIPLFFLDDLSQEVRAAGNSVFESRFESFDECIHLESSNTRN